jgi:23S rRNA pseudouridine2605 synthase
MVTNCRAPRIRRLFDKFFLAPFGAEPFQDATIVIIRTRPQKLITRERDENAVKKTLDRVLSQAGIGSRTEASRWIEGGRVAVNGAVVRQPDHWVDPVRDRVSLDGRPLEQQERVYVLLYKPKGIVTTYQDPDGRQTVYDLIRAGVRQFVGTVGRLDMDTSGLLLMTNDHLLADRLTGPAFHVEKEYLIKAAHVLTGDQLAQLRRGVTLDDGPTRPARVERLRDSEKYTHLTMVLTEGRNRQVRRMVESIGSHVLKLVRTRIGPLTLEGLTIGGWRMLTRAEVQQLGGGAALPGAKPKHAGRAASRRDRPE